MMGKLSQFDIKDLNDFEDWLQQYQLLDSTIKKYVMAMTNVLKSVNGVDKEQLNIFLKKHPRPFYKSSIEYYLEFKGYDFKVMKVKIPQRKPIESIELSQLRSILDKIKGFKNVNMDVYWLTSLLFHTGARINEVLRLKINDIDFNNNLIIFKDTGRQIKKDRPIKVHKNIIKKLHEYAVVTKGLLGNERVVYTHHKDPINSQSAYMSYRNYIERLVKNNIITQEDSRLIVKSHNFRRSVINHILDLTEYNLLPAGQYVGHSKPDTTMRYVDDLRKEKAKNIAEDVMLKEE